MDGLLRNWNSHRLLCWTLFAALLLTVLMGPAQETAKAADTPSDRPSRAVVSPMRIIGFDREIAAAHGYKISTRNGAQVSVKSSGSATNLQPFDTAYGNCGSSYFYLSGGDNIYYFNTGFSLNTRAVDFYWHVDIDGPWTYDRDWYWEAPLPLSYGWRSGTRSSYVDDTGWYAGEVQTGYAFLLNGGICSTGHPSDRDRVN
jgi:hypothetical protein